MLENTGMQTDQRSRIERELFLRAMSIAKPPPEATRQIAQILRDSYPKKGAVLFQRGDQPKSCLYVASGEIVMSGVDEDDISFGPGSLIGILDCNIGRPRARTAVVSEDAHVLEMPYSQWLDILEDFPDYTASARRIVSSGVHGVIVSMPPSGGLDQLGVAGQPAADTEMVSRIVMLHKTHMFDTASFQAVAEIADRGEILNPDAGDLIVRPGSSKDRLYLVMRGTVHVERRIAPEIRATFGPGQIVLGGACFSGALASYAVIAGAKTSVFAIDQVEIDDVSDDHFDVVRSCLRGMSMDRDQLMSLRAKGPGSRRSQMPPPSSSSV